MGKHEQAYHKLDRETMEVIAEVANNKRILERLDNYESEEGGRYNMCKAMEDMVKEGIEIGMVRALKGLVQDGILSLEAAAGRVNMTTEEFLAKGEKR